MHANSKGGGRGLQLLEKAAWGGGGGGRFNLTEQCHSCEGWRKGNIPGRTGGDIIKGGSRGVFKKRSKSGEGSQWRIVNLENSIGPRLQRG